MADAAGQQATDTRRGLRLLLLTFFAAAAAAYYARSISRITDNSAEKQLRAYITIERALLYIDISPRGRAKLVGNINFINSGQTPAYEVEIETHIKFMDDDDMPDFTSDDTDNNFLSKSIMGPGGMSPVMPMMDVSPQAEDDINSERSRAFIWGRCTYFDVFRKTRRYYEFKRVNDKNMIQTEVRDGWPLQTYGTDKAN